MIKMVKGREYVYRGTKIYNGQELRLQADIEADLVSTGLFEYLGAPQVMYIKPNMTNELMIGGRKYKIELNKPKKIPKSIGYKIVQLGFAKEIPLRRVIIEDRQKIEKTLFVRDGGLGDIVILYAALVYLMKVKGISKIHIMTEKRYTPIFEQDDRFIISTLDNYRSETAKFDYVLDLRMTVEGDPNTGDKNRLLLFIRLLGLDIQGKIASDYIKYTRLRFKPGNLDKFNESLSGKYAVVNIGTSRPERNLMLEPLKGLINKIAASGKFDHVILLHHQRFNQKFDNKKIVNLTAVTSVKESMDIIAKAEAYFGLDTGPSHIAGALGIKGLVVGGAINMDLRYTQYPSLRTLQKTMECVLKQTCYQCSKNKNPNAPGQCMDFNADTLYNKFMEAIK